eukprot:COSAG05_NODE_7346_length_824_cov_1.194483_1_plen_112_part_00
MYYLATEYGIILDYGGHVTHGRNHPWWRGAAAHHLPIHVVPHRPPGTPVAASSRDRLPTPSKPLLLLRLQRACCAVCGKVIAVTIPRRAGEQLVTLDTKGLVAIRHRAQRA